MSQQKRIFYQELTNKKRTALFDKIIIVASFVYPLSALPQVYEVFQGNIAGVSVVSWFGFLFFSVLFLIYGKMHNVKPMIITNLLWILVDGLVVVGAIIRGASL